MIVVLAGTNRPNSNSRRVATLVDAMLQASGAQTHLMSLADLPPEIFAPTSYAEKPASFAPFQQAILEADGLFIVTPEYNGSFPGVLKYFIDMLKFPESLRGMPVALLGLGAGEWGGLRSVEQLAMILWYRSVHLFGKRVFLKHINNLLDADGRITDDAVRERMESQARDFATFCNMLRPSLGSSPS